MAVFGQAATKDTVVKISEEYGGSLNRTSDFGFVTRMWAMPSDDYKQQRNEAYLRRAGDNSTSAVTRRPRKLSALLNEAWTPWFWKHLGYNSSIWVYTDYTDTQYTQINMLGRFTLVVP